MAFSKQTRKILIVIVLSMVFISTKSTTVLAYSKSPIDIDKQAEFLEKQRILQGEIFSERMKNAKVEGMLSYKEVENRRNAIIERENEIKKQERTETDIYSQVVRSIRKLQKKKRESNQFENQASRTNSYYNNTGIPIINSSNLKADRIQLSETFNNISPEMKEYMESNPLLKQLEVIKGLIDKPVTHGEPLDMNSSDIEMLEQIVMSESGAEPYLGQIAVANVVLNRVKSKRYPSTLEGVIFQKSQFSPVKDGVIRGYAPNASVKKAVAEALNGRMIVPEDTLYFVNPVLATDQTIPRTKTPVRVIGTHTFYR